MTVFPHHIVWKPIELAGATCLFTRSLGVGKRLYPWGGNGFKTAEQITASPRN